MLDLVRKIATKGAVFVTIFLIIADSEILPAGKQPNIKSKIARRTAIDIGILRSDRKIYTVFPVQR